MPMSLFKKIVNDSASIDKITQILLNGLGEPALDPLLIDRVKHASATGKEVTFHTNGVYITPKLFDSLKDAGLTGINFSLNANTEEQHEKIMGLKGKFRQTCDNIDYAIANKGNVKILVTGVGNGDTFDLQEVFKFYDRWGHHENGGYGRGVSEANWAGDNRTIKELKPSDGCMRAWSQIYVMYDGRVSMCCFDPTGKTIFGDLKKQSLREIYESDAYLRFREAHYEDRADEYEACKVCTRI